MHEKLFGTYESFTSISPQQFHLPIKLISSQDELPHRTMQDSFQSVVIPLSTDLDLQAKYVSFLGHVRIGRVLEDMDKLSGWICYCHMLNPEVPDGSAMPHVFVTILVDHVDIEDTMLRYDADIRLSGHVSWVGGSSIETVVWLEQKINEKWVKLIRALFLMAARDKSLKKAAIVNKLIAKNVSEQEIIKGGEARKKRRQKAAQQSLLKVVPNEEEQKIIYDLFLQSSDIDDPSYTRRVLPNSSMWMKHARLMNAIYCHPENKNLHNKVFGGFLMRQALELSWACAWVVSKHHPKLKHVSDILFHKAVDVSALMKMKAQVVYSEVQYMQIMVTAEVYEPRSGNVSTTNVFHFTYQIPIIAPMVIPKSYHEAMMYLEGRRQFQKVMGLKPVP